MKKKRKFVNIRSTSELARHLGLSRWSISRVLNQKPGVSIETADMIRKAISKYGFIPDPAARSLRGGKTATIGICLQEMENLNLRSKISAIQNRLKGEGYRGLLEFTLGEEQVEDDVIRHFASMRVEGIIIIASQQTSRSDGFKLIKAQDIPAVFLDPIDCRLPGSVMADRKLAMKLIVDHLCSLGHKKIAVLGIRPDMIYGKVRIQGIIEAAKAHRIAPSSLRFVSNQESTAADYRCGWALAEKYFEGAHDESAIIALNDRIAFGIMAYMKNTGLAVPQDVSIVGYDNMDIAEFVSPPLTTIDAHVDLLVNDAIDDLMFQIRNKSDANARVHTIKPDIVVRNTTSAVSHKIRRK